jgi:hypothetical protein
MVNLRARSVSIKLQCLNADIILTEHADSLWSMPEPNTLSRRLFNLNNYTDYIEQIDTNIIGINDIDFYVEFITIGMDGQEFLMDK